MVIIQNSESGMFGPPYV